MASKHIVDSIVYVWQHNLNGAVKQLPDMSWLLFAPTNHTQSVSYHIHIGKRDDEPNTGWYSIKKGKTSEKGSITMDYNGEQWANWLYTQAGYAQYVPTSYGKAKKDKPKISSYSRPVTSLWNKFKQSKSYGHGGTRRKKNNTKKRRHRKRTICISK